RSPGGPVAAPRDGRHRPRPRHRDLPLVGRGRPRRGWLPRRPGSVAGFDPRTEGVDEANRGTGFRPRGLDSIALPLFYRVFVRMALSALLVGSPLLAAI